MHVEVQDQPHVILRSSLLCLQYQSPQTWRSAGRPSWLVTEPHGSSGLSLPRLRLQAQATTLDFSWVLGVQTQLLVPHGKHFMVSLAFCLLVQGNAELSELWSPECTILSSVRHKTASSS